jgi:hypothetical protein
VIPPSALGNRLYLLLWIVVLLLPVAGWLVAALVTAAFGRRGTGNPLWRAAVHAGEMAALALAIPFLVRILLWGVLAVRGGPIDWAAWLLAPHPVVLADFLLIYAAIPLGLAAMFGTPVLALVGALLREKPPLRVPLGGPLAAALITSALVVPFVARFALSDPDADVALADLFAALPVSAVGLAIWTASLRRAPPAKPEPVRPATPAGPPAIDIPGLWRAMGAIDADQQPLVHPGVDRTGGSPFATSAWRDAGGAGAPPEALDHLLTAVEKPGGSYLIGDLDDDTERALLVALLVSALRDKSLTTVVITEDPGPFRDAVAHALSRGGWWGVRSARGGRGGAARGAGRRPAAGGRVPRRRRAVRERHPGARSGRSGRRVGAARRARGGVPDRPRQPARPHPPGAHVAQVGAGVPGGGHPVGPGRHRPRRGTAPAALVEQAFPGTGAAGDPVRTSRVGAGDRVVRVAVVRARSERPGVGAARAAAGARHRARRVRVGSRRSLRPRRRRRVGGGTSCSGGRRCCTDRRRPERCPCPGWSPGIARCHTARARSTGSATTRCGTSRPRRWRGS